ncbi:hypothetical protein [Caulobacter sp. BK020]|uniref:hypothetical protein n=1 Tax=Caulobacter sp. BK020 TaxID=2512117 RepID=UPI0010435820|nr:hypothetical protein [Caulobacter sp. BK020]TCS14584.1 hypothetical protein EV278_107233 [Caulobacter sp. BK020]
MDASVLLPHRTALTGAAVALAVGLTGGLILRTGSQTAPQVDTVFLSGPAGDTVQPIAWPTGKVPDYVVGTDFLPGRQPEQPPEVVASYEVPEYVPAAWSEPEPEIQTEAQYIRPAEPVDRNWPSTAGDILNTRLPEDAPQAPEPPPVIAAPQAPSAPMAVAAAY